MQQKKVKDLISSKVSLAPMAGITDCVLRTLVREHSKTCLLTTEMISSEALTQVKDTDIVVENYDGNVNLISVQEVNKDILDGLTQTDTDYAGNIVSVTGKVSVGSDKYSYYLLDESDNIIIQTTVFVISSSLLIFATKPLVKKLKILNRKQQLLK